MVRYLPERVLRQFGRVQTIPRHLVESAPLDVNLTEITNRFRRALDYALKPQQLGERVVHDVEAVDGYIDWCIAIPIHAWFFLTCRYRCRGHRSVRPLMRELLRRMETLGTYSLAEG